MKILYIGIGGFLGAITRYGVSGFVYRVFGKTWFPYGTLTVNIVGCFLIGFLSGLSENRQLFTPEIRVLVFIGFLGSFTTFSTFGYESYNLLRDGQIAASLINVISQILIGFSAVWLGYSLPKMF